MEGSRVPEGVARRLGAFSLLAGVSAMVLSLALPAAASANGNGHAHGKGKHDSAEVTTTAVGDSGNGANQDCGAYCPSGVGLPSGNGNGNGNATGKPCAGCVGNADSKNPPGQAPDGSDHNNGYECDGNHGIGRTNPAHSGCSQTTSTTEPPGCEQDSDKAESDKAESDEHDSGGVESDKAKSDEHESDEPGCTTTTTAAPAATTTTTAEPGSTTTTAPTTTTTSVSPGVTVLGEQFNRPAAAAVAPAQAAKGLAFTGGQLAKLFYTGLALALLGVVLVGHRSYARSRA